MIAAFPLQKSFPLEVVFTAGCTACGSQCSCWHNCHNSLSQLPPSITPYALPWWYLVTEFLPVKGQIPVASSHFCVWFTPMTILSMQTKPPLVAPWVRDDGTKEFNNSWSWVCPGTTLIIVMLNSCNAIHSHCDGSSHHYYSNQWWWRTAG